MSNKFLYIFNRLNMGIKHKNTFIIIKTFQKNFVFESIFKIFINYNMISRFEFYNNPCNFYKVYFNLKNESIYLNFDFKINSVKTVSFLKLKYLFYNNSTTVYILSTNYGIICSNDALQKKCGGILLFKIYL